MQSKILVLYHSVQGNTEKVAKVLAETLKSDLIKINEKDNSSSIAPLAAAKVVRQIAQGNQFKSRFEEIDLSKYKSIYIGGPCWNYTYTPAIGQFLKNADYKDKEIIFFITHLGDIGKSIEKFKNEMIGGTFRGSMDFYKVNKMDKNELREKVKSQLNKLK
jgi:Flavodoxin